MFRKNYSQCIVGLKTKEESKQPASRSDSFSVSRYWVLITPVPGSQGKCPCGPCVIVKTMSSFPSSLRYWFCSGDKASGLKRKRPHLDLSPPHLPPDVDQLLLQLSNPQAYPPPPLTSPTSTTTSSTTPAGSGGSRVTTGRIPSSSSLPSSSSSFTTHSQTTQGRSSDSYLSRGSGLGERGSGLGERGSGMGERGSGLGERGSGGSCGGGGTAKERSLARELDRCHLRPTPTPSQSAAPLCTLASPSDPPPPSSSSSSIKPSASSPSSLSLLSSAMDGSGHRPATARRHRLYRTRQEVKKAREEEHRSSRGSTITAADLDDKGRSLDTVDRAEKEGVEVGEDSYFVLSKSLRSMDSDLSKTSSTLSSLCSEGRRGSGHDLQLNNNNNNSNNNNISQSSSKSGRTGGVRRIQKSATTTLLSYPPRASFDHESSTPEVSDSEEKDPASKKKEKEKEGGGKKRFGKKMLAKTLRRSQSASNARDVPAHALFLRHHLGDKGLDTLEDRVGQDLSRGSGGGGWRRGGEGECRRTSLPRPIHKTTSADAAMMSMDEFGNVTCPQGKSGKKSLAKTMKKKLQFLRRRHTDSTLSTLAKREGKHLASVDPDQALQWGRSFESLLTDTKGLELFRGFLRSEFSEENLEFWVAVEDFKLVKPRKVSSLARSIYTHFVEEQAPREINVDSGTRLRTLANLETPSKSVFEEAQRKVQALMAKDSYPRFLESDVYQQLISSSKC